MTKSQDFVDSLGILTLAHQFKRMTQRLLDESAELNERLGLRIKPRWGSTLLLLEAEGPLSVSDVADRLQFSHAAVVQSLDDMAFMGLILRGKDPDDGRRSVLTLSAKGRRAMPALHEAWKHVAEVQEEIFNAAGGDVLGMLERANAALDDKNLAERVLERMERSTAPRKTKRRAARGPGGR